MSPRERILFVTSNGTGLGHLTRSLAIARRLDRSLEPLFVTFSAAAPVVRDLGYPVEYVASYDRPGAGNDWRWTRRVRERLRAIVGEARPEVVVFDGTHPYERLLPALRSRGSRLVWCRRAMWRPDSDASPLWRSHLFDAVLEPGELAAEADAGPTVARRDEARSVGPIVLLDRSELLPRAEAERELGLEPARVSALVQLGQGSGVREANERALRQLAARDDVQVAAAASALATLDEVPGGVVRLPATYPVSRYLAAFDLAVAAAGYNAFHELLTLGVPALYVPMPRLTDDQRARARWAEAQGLGKACRGPGDPELELRLDELLDRDAREAIRVRLDALEARNGAGEAAAWLGELGGGEARREPAAPGGAVAGGAGGSVADQSRGSGAAQRSGPRPAAGPWVRIRRAWIFVASIPRTVARLARQVLTRPRVRAVVVALGIPEADLGPRVEAAVASLGERPERTLVITDALDFAPLLAAGVGFEHVPRRGDRQPQLAGRPYEDFLAERVRMIASRRPRPRRVVAVGDVAPEVLAAARRARTGRTAKPA